MTSISNALITLAGLRRVIIGVPASPDGRRRRRADGVVPGLYCVALVAIVIGFSLASSVLFLRYRDLNQVWDVVTQAGFFLAPIMYPLGIIPERFHFYLYLWPPTPIIEFSRAVLVARRLPTPTAHAVSGAAWRGVILAAGVVVFRALAPRAAEYV